MKRRTFGDGGGVPPGGRFDADTYARARAWIAAGSPEKKEESSKAKPKTETKSAAKASPSPAPKPAVKTSSPSPSPSSAPAKSTSTTRAEIPKDTSVKAPASKGGRSLSDTERNVLNTVGAVSGLRGFKPALAAGKKVVESSRALAKSETPVTFLGASGRKNITPKEAIGNKSQPKLEGLSSSTKLGTSPKPKQLTGKADTPRLSAPTKTKTKVARKSAPKKTNPKKPSVNLGGGKSLSGRARTKYDDNPGVEFKRGGKVK